MEARRLPAYLPKTAKNNLYLEILEALKGWLTVKSNPEISEALKKGKEVVDIQVENALLKRALGYEYTEERIEISEKDGKKVIQTVKQVIPDTTAIIFWLKNRRPGKWRSDPQENGNTAQAGAHSALIAAIRERRHAN